MKNIEVKILNPFAIIDAEKMLATTARITQRGEKIANTEDFLKVHNMSYDMNWLERMCNLPHPTILKELRPKKLTPFLTPVFHQTTPFYTNL